MNKIQGKIIEGKVVSMGMEKTVVVQIVHQFRHPLYKKAVNRMQKYAVHNPGIEVAVGDTVKIQETKPISKNKHFILLAKV